MSQPCQKKIVLRLINIAPRLTVIFKVCKVLSESRPLVTVMVVSVLMPPEASPWIEGVLPPHLEGVLRPFLPLSRAPVGAQSYEFVNGVVNVPVYTEEEECLRQEGRTNPLNVYPQTTYSPLPLVHHRTHPFDALMPYVRCLSHISLGITPHYPQELHGQPP